jgi:hypothetical protein
LQISKLIISTQQQHRICIYYRKPLLVGSQIPLHITIF